MPLNFLPLQKIRFITILALCLVAMASPAALAPLAVPGGRTDLVRRSQSSVPPLPALLAHARRSSNDALLDIDVTLGLGTEYPENPHQTYDKDRGHDYDHDQDQDSGGHHNYDHKHTHEHIHTHNDRMAPRYLYASRGYFM
ncbi:hypothetical protein PILCRDRAFT_824375 [Piloderma croceum F 1598]|uniref:Uncharacterized protein n=1 Tax=Piloderma croceum (strain F 1598) TaxID=765440 RepID=A0A0C3AWU1_PILCF|nr:hypothetical protein PILCRDRAFT_824375 [Piloderma croceum F 1598]